MQITLEFREKSATTAIIRRRVSAIKTISRLRRSSGHCVAFRRISGTDAGDNRGGFSSRQLESRSSVRVFDHNIDQHERTKRDSVM